MNPAEWADYERKLDEIIAQNGWAVQSNMPTDYSPPFSYSVGMTEALRCPEMLIIGIGHQIATAVINGLGASIQKKRDIVLEDWSRSEMVVDGFPIVFRNIPWQVRGQWTFVLDRKYPEKHDVLQIVLPDANGKFPWDDGVDPIFGGEQRHLITKADEFRRLI